MARYLALIDGSGKTWGVRVPDFPGCHGGGPTIEAAVNDATRALREFAADMLSDGQEIPTPRSFETIKAQVEAEGEEWGMTTYIPLLIDHARPVKANISLSADLLAAIDGAAQERGMTRSAFLASAALEKIAEDR